MKTRDRTSRTCREAIKKDMRNVDLAPQASASLEVTRPRTNYYNSNMSNY